MGIITPSFNKSSLACRSFSVSCCNHCCGVLTILTGINKSVGVHSSWSMNKAIYFHFFTRADNPDVAFIPIMVNLSLREEIITEIFLNEVMPIVTSNLICLPRTLEPVTACKLKGDPLFLKCSLSWEDRSKQCPIGGGAG